MGSVTFKRQQGIQQTHQGVFKTLSGRRYTEDLDLRHWQHAGDNETWHMGPEARCTHASIFLGKPNTIPKCQSRQSAQHGLSVHGAPTWEVQLMTNPDDLALSAENKLTRLQAEIAQDPELHCWCKQRSLDRECLLPFADFPSKAL